MAVLELTYRSHVLDFDQNLLVMFPDPSGLKLSESDKGTDFEFPVLYLLHGYSDDHTSWLRRSSVERYLTEDLKKPLVIVCPSVQNSFYSDMVYGWKYFKYLTEEVPELLKRWIKISTRREDTFVAGLSMGGYGAYKLAFTYPERFSIAASFSGALDLAESGRGNPDKDVKCSDVFGMKRSETDGTEFDLKVMLQKAVDSGKELPKFYLSCGTKDPLYRIDLGFRDLMEKKGIKVNYSETEGLAHEWKFWDQEIEKFLKVLPLKSLEEIRR